MIDRSKKPLPFDDEDFGNAFPSERPTSPNGEHLPDASNASGTSSEDSQAGAEDRPTISPPFDIEEYARTSDSKLRASKPSGALEKSTKPPPSSNLTIDLELDDVELDSGLDALSLGTGFRPPQITLTDDDELETARLRSVLLPSEPPPAARNSSRAAALAMIEDRATPPPKLQYPEGFEEKDPFTSPAAGTGARAGARAAANASSAPKSGAGANTAGPPSQQRAQEAPRKGAARVRDMLDRVALGDYTGALEIAEAILQVDPVNAEALRCADESRATLQQMYTARIGPMDRVPMVMVPREQLRWLSIDHRAGFLLSHVDGVSSLEMILDVSGMPTLDALRILCELAQQRVISFR